MKFDNHILVIISVVSLFFIILTKGTDFSQSLSNEDEIFDDIKTTFRPTLNDVKEKLGPISTLDFDLDEAKEALGPIPSFDDAKEAFGPSSSSILDKAKEVMGPISPAALDEAKQALGPATDKAKEALSPISPSAIEEAKKALGPASDKAKEALGPASSSIIDKAKDKLDSITSWITQNKEQVSSDTETQQESDPKKAQPEPPPSSLDPYGILDGAKQKFNSLLDSITEEKTQISQNESTAQKVLDPVSPSDEDGSSPGPAPSPSILDKAKQLISSKTKLQIPAPASSSSDANPVYLDHDVALVVESMIKQAETNSQLAIDEAKTLFSDPNIVDSSDYAKCIKKCLSDYESCNLKLNKAMEDLKARNVELLTDDIGSVEGDIYDCQKCFQEHTDKQSPFNDLEEATIKATRECINVLDHSG